MSEHQQKPEQANDTAPRFVVAKALEYNPDINAPRYEIQDQPAATLPELSAEQLDLMSKLTPEEWNAETLDSLGLPAGEGIVAVSVDGEKRYVNIGLEDYGTTVQEKRIKVVAEAEPVTIESAEQHELLSEEVREDLGEAALEAMDIDEPTPESGDEPSVEAEEQEPGYNEALDRLKGDMEHQLRATRDVIDMVENTANGINEAFVSRMHYAESAQDVYDLIAFAEQMTHNVLEEPSGLQQLTRASEELAGKLERFENEQADAAEADRKTGEKHEELVHQVKRELTVLTEEANGIKDAFNGMNKLNDTIQEIKNWLGRGGVLDTRNIEHETIQIGRFVNNITEATYAQRTALNRIENAFQEARL